MPVRYRHGLIENLTTSAAGPYQVAPSGDAQCPCRKPMPQTRRPRSRRLANGSHGQSTGNPCRGPSTVMALARWRDRARGRRLGGHSVDPQGPEDGFDRRRLRERPRDVRRAARCRAGRACWSTTTTACARAICSCSSTRSRIRCRSNIAQAAVTAAQADLVAAQAQARGHRRADAEPALQPASTRSRTWTTRSRCCGPKVATLQIAKGHAGQGTGRLSTAPSRSSQSGRDHRRKNSITARSCCGGEGAGRGGAAGRLPGSRRARPAAQARNGRRSDRGAARSGPDLFLGPAGASESDASGRAARA